MRLTKSLHWIGTEVGQVPMFNGLSNIQEFLQEYEVQVPRSQRLKNTRYGTVSHPCKMVGCAQEEHHHVGNLPQIANNQVW